MSRHKKFQIGDIVQIADDLGPGMSHYSAGKPAVVMYTYSTEYGSGEITLNDQYGLYIGGEGTCAWYYPHQLTKIGRLKRIRGVSFPTQTQLENAAKRYFKQARGPATSLD